MTGAGAPSGAPSRRFHCGVGPRFRGRSGFPFGPRPRFALCLRSVRRHPPGTTFHYLVNRRGSLVEVDIASKVEPARGFARFLLEGLLPGLLFLGLGAAVLVLKPGAPDARVFLLFCLIWFVTAALYRDVTARSDSRS